MKLLHNEIKILFTTFQYRVRIKKFKQRGTEALQIKDTYLLIKTYMYNENSSWDINTEEMIAGISFVIFLEHFKPLRGSYQYGFM